MSGRMPHYGFSENIGIKDVGFVSKEHGGTFNEPKYKVSLPLNADHLNGSGLLHGGVVATLLDACMARVFFMGLAEEEMATLKNGVTVEMKTSFLRTTDKGTVHALGAIVKRGRTMSFTSGELFDEQGKLLATATATMMIVRK